MVRNLNVNIQKVIGDIVFLEIVVQEYARFARHAYKGIPKGQHDDANSATRRYLQKGRAATPAMKLHAVQALKLIYIEKGFLDSVECGLCTYVCPSKIELNDIFN